MRIKEITRYNPILKKNITNYYLIDNFGTMSLIPKQSLKRIKANLK